LLFLFTASILILIHKNLLLSDKMKFKKPLL